MKKKPKQRRFRWKNSSIFSREKQRDLTNTFHGADMHARGGFFLWKCAVAVVLVGLLPHVSNVVEGSLPHKVIIFRHGDRTPITPMSDTNFWSMLLPSDETVAELGRGVAFVNDEDRLRKHMAAGKGCFGKLTSLGLMQMVKLGETASEGARADDRTRHALDPSQVRWISTGFDRTKQSMLGFVCGFFEGERKEDVRVDCSHTNIIIPDPQPRNSDLQRMREKQILESSDHVEWERGWESDRKRICAALEAGDVLAEEAKNVKFGGGEDDSSSEGLSWGQISEVLRCLSTRGILPEALSEDDLSLAEKVCLERCVTNKINKIKGMGMLLGAGSCWRRLHHLTLLLDVAFLLLQVV